MDNQQITVLIAMLIQFATGYVTHKVGNDKVRKLIPIPLFVISLLTQIVTGFQSAAGPAAAALHAGVFGTFGGKFLDILVNSIIQTLIPVGGFSAQKNVREGVQMALAEKAATTK